MMTVTLLHEIREYERRLAPGSETNLWGEFIDNRMLPSQHGPTVDPAEAAWWLGAYRALEAVDAAGPEPFDEDGRWLVPTEPTYNDVAYLADTIGQATPPALQQFEDGSRWLIDREQPAAGGAS